MRVLVTGATGFIGTAVVGELTTAGHRVVGLARTDDAVRKLSAQGLEYRRGDLSDMDGLAAVAGECDGIVHLAFDHDFSRYAQSIEIDRRAVELMTSALENSGKPMVIASGTLMVAHAHPGTEVDVPAGLNVPRGASEALMLAAASRGVRSCVVRLPPSVHDLTRAGFVTAMTDIARNSGFSAYVGDGANRWPAVHRLDAARLFALAFDRAEAGARVHAVAEEGIPTRVIAEAIAARLDVPVRSITTDEAAGHFGWLARFIAIDNETLSDTTRRTLGWYPGQQGLLEDIASGEERRDR